MTAPTTILPNLSRFDPLSTSEGTLDPLGLYQIADQLAVSLVPSVRERMSRIGFLVAMTISATVVEELEGRQGHRDAAPHLIWEWLVIEALVRAAADGDMPWGIPGSLVTRRALAGHGYLDAASYLKTPRIFGFHGIYKRLAVHLGLVDVNLTVGPNAARLLDAWARDHELSGYSDAREQLKSWRDGVARSLRQDPPKTAPGWRASDWAHLADTLQPHKLRKRQRRVLRELLLDEGDRQLGALPDVWRIAQQQEDGVGDQEMHRLLKRANPRWQTLLAAIEAYEMFARALQDSFDAIRDAAAAATGSGLRVQSLATSDSLRDASQGLDTLFRKASEALGAVEGGAQASGTLFEERFGAFASPLPSVDLARALLDHHEAIQRAKSAEGKRSWFDRLGPNHVHLRFPYRLGDWAPSPGEYLHPYRTGPILNFLGDVG